MYSLYQNCFQKSRKIMTKIRKNIFSFLLKKTLDKMRWDVL
nr:MAG TPA: hypothetical protein [Caudoviricetes sp.]